MDEDEWSFDKEGVATADQPGRTDSSSIFEYDYDFVLTESSSVMTEEPTTEEPITTTTKKAKTTKATTTTTTTTTTEKPVAVESTGGEKTKTGRKPSINRTRAPSTSTSSRRVMSTTTAAAAAADDDLEEVTEAVQSIPKRGGGQKIKSTSPASLDTSSVAIKAPFKGFKPTAKPMADESEPKDLMEFLKKRNNL
jgi:hypothetical protein